MIKKKIFMMALAASMTLSTQIISLGSSVTQVLAEENATSTALLVFQDEENSEWFDFMIPVSATCTHLKPEVYAYYLPQGYHFPEEPQMIDKDESGVFFVQVAPNTDDDKAALSEATPNSTHRFKIQYFTTSYSLIDCDKYSSEIATPAMVQKSLNKKGFYSLDLTPDTDSLDLVPIAYKKDGSLTIIGYKYDADGVGTCTDLNGATVTLKSSDPYPYSVNSLVAPDLSEIALTPKEWTDSMICTPNSFKITPPQTIELGENTASIELSDNIWDSYELTLNQPLKVNYTVYADLSNVPTNQIKLEGLKSTYYLDDDGVEFTPESEDTENSEVPQENEGNNNSENQEEEPTQPTVQKKVEPNITKVTVYGTELTVGENGDCTLQFENNIGAGTGQVIITATTVSKKCSGTSKPITFEIKEGTAPVENTAPSTTTTPSTTTPAEPENPTPVITPIANGDVSFAETGPYILKDNSTVEPKVAVTVSGTKLVEGTDYTVSYKNSNAVGEATVTVTGKGNYTGTVNKTYTIIAVKEDSVDIALGSGEEAVSLEVPTEYLPSDGTLTDETLSKALNDQSANEKPADAPSAPSYTYEVSGLKGEKPVIKVKVERKSLIRLILNKVASIINQDTQILEMEEMTEAEEVSNNSVVVYATLEQLDTNGDNKVTKEEVEAYIKNKPEYKNAQVPEGFKTQDYSKSLELGSEVTISKDGFIEINADVEVAKPSHKPSSGGSSSKPVTKPEEPVAPVVGTPTTIYRLYNTLTGEHLYTIDKSEKDKLLTSTTWQDEDQGWIAPSISDYPVYRLLNPNTTDHHYTTDKNEYDTLQTKGWVGEGIAFYSADTKNNDNVLLHRLYNPNETGAGSHHYTVDVNEKDALVKLGWQYEGTAWAGLKSE